MNETSLAPSQSPYDLWLATHLTQPLYNFRSNIWIVVPKHRSPALPTIPIQPYTTCSTAVMEAILRRHGFQRVRGGKGSHVKMTKDGIDRPVILPGNRKSLSPGVTKQALRVIGYDLRDLPDLM